MLLSRPLEHIPANLKSDGVNPVVALRAFLVATGRSV